EGSAGWNPLPELTLWGDMRRARYSRGRTGDRAHLAAGLTLPAGVSVHADVAWANDLQAAVDTADTLQRTLDVAGAVQWDRDWISVEVGQTRRDAFAPIGVPVALGAVARFGPAQRTRYLTTRGVVRLLPGLELAGWYFDPIVRGGDDFEPPYHTRVSLTFYSRFWRVYRSGIFALRVEAASESWSRGVAGLDSSGAPLALPGRTFGELNVQIRIAGVTIFWIERGPVTLSARWSEPPATESAVTVDLARARQVLAAARELKKRLKLKGEVDLAFVARHPDVLAPERDGAAAEWSEVEPIVERA